MSTVEPTEPLYSQGSDDSDELLISSQLEDLSLGEGDLQEKPRRKKGKGGAKDVWAFFEKGEGRGKGKGKGRKKVDGEDMVNICKFCM
jgi:hypothetical protein